MALPTDDNGFAEYLRTLKQHGYATSNADLKKGYAKLDFGDSRTTSQIGSQSDWNYQNRILKNQKPLNFPTLSYDPYSHNDLENQAMHDYYTKYGTSPTDEEFTKFYTPNYLYKGKYENTVEDQNNLKNGLAPQAVQTSDKAKAELSDLDSKFKALGPDATFAQYQSILNAEPTLSKLTNDALGNGAQAKNNYLTELLTPTGYDPKKGFQGLLDPYNKNLRDQGYENSTDGSGAPAG